MKKVIISVVLLLIFVIPSVNAVENAECNLNINIVGEGKLIDQSTNIEYKKNDVIQHACNTALNFLVIPGSNYKLNYVKYNNQLIGGDLIDVGMQYKIIPTLVDSTVSIEFISKFDISTVKIDNVDYNYIEGLNRLEVVLKNNNLDFSVVNLKDYINEKTVFYLELSDIKLEFAKGFLYQYLNDTLRINVHETGNNVLAEAQAKAVKNGTFYDFNFFVAGDKKNKFSNPVMVSIPYQLESGFTQRVYKVDADGNKVEVKSTYEDDTVNFELDEFSLIAISQEKNINSSNSNSSHGRFDKITDFLATIDTSILFTVFIIVGFGIYMYKDYKKHKK